MRLQGASYEEIARAGGGIASTVRRDPRGQRRSALAAGARRRLDALRANGVTTVEIKSGYGLDLATELRMLEVARALGGGPGLDGPHQLPRRPCPAARVRRRPGGYIDLVCDECCRRSRRRASPTRSTPSARASPSRRPRSRACSPAAGRHGLPVKLHAEQLSDLGGSALAARFGALSADHLEYVERGGRPRDGRGRHGRGAAARRLLLLARDASGRRSSCCAGWASRSRSPPTATPARRR